MQRILIVNTAGLGVGGITTHMLNYLSYISNKDIKIDVIETLYYEKEVEEKFEEIGCHVIKLSNRKKNTIKYLFELKGLCAREKYSVMHVHGNSASMAMELIIGRNAGINTRIAHCHSRKCDHKIIHKLLNPIFMRAYTQAVACSKVAGEWIFGKDNYVVLRNAIDVSQYRFDINKRKQIREDMQIKDNDILLAQIGALTNNKNPEFSLRIAESFGNNKKLLYIGTGELFDALNTSITEMNLSNVVRCLGLRKDINELLQAIDILLMPSKFEGLPLTLVEAQTAGVKCIVSDNVSEEAKLSDKTWGQLPLEEDLWLKRIEECNDLETRNDAYKMTIEKGFDIKSNVGILRLMYKI